MDNNELTGRVTALEILLAEVVAKLPRETVEAVLKGAMPALQRQPAELSAYTTQLAAQIQRRLPKA